MKKIGIDARFFTSKATGIGRHVYELVQGLARIDTENEYIIFLKPEEYEIFELPGQNFKKEKTDAKHYSFAEQWNLLRQLNAHQFDLMVFPHFNAPIFYNRPFVVTIHDLTLHLFPGKKKADRVSRLAYKFVIHQVTKKAKHCFAVSENTKRDMMKYLNTPEQKITVTYNGVTQSFAPVREVEVLHAFRSKYNLPEKYFLYTGVSRSHKNIVGLLQAYALFLKNNPDADISFVLAGPIDKTYSEVPETIKALNLEDKVIRPGFFPEEDFAKLFSASVGYVFPTFYEGFGIPPLEAMQCGVPVATSNTSSLPEACGEAAIYFDPYDIQDMARALEQLAFDENLRRVLIDKGYRQCRKFRWEDMVGRMYEVYQKILNEN